MKPLSVERDWETRLRQQSRENLLKWILLVMAILILITVCVVATSQGADRPTPHPAQHQPVETYEPDQRMLVHNQPSYPRHQWWGARHPRLFGFLVVGAASGAGAAIAISERRGICQGVYEGQNYYGTAPCPKGTIGAH